MRYPGKFVAFKGNVKGNRLKHLAGFLDLTYSQYIINIPEWLIHKLKRITSNPYLDS